MILGLGKLRQEIYYECEASLNLQGEFYASLGCGIGRYLKIQMEECVRESVHPFDSYNWADNKL